jgi:nitric oxide reductase activation protein
VGRLGKKLLRVMLDDHPRLFYKKQAESRELDVVFTLLVDCSASMHDKMQETKIGIALFHESLKSLGIPHAVTGFWEDALSADENRQPNYFLDVIEWETSLLPGQGVKTMQLQPEEDNRDGFAIREMVKQMRRRPEKHKILIVFTDGEPSAFNYQDQGIVDTHEAVLLARKLGIDVIGVLLSDAYTQDQEKETLTHIYGKTSLIAPSASEIPAILTPLLRKLLSQIIQ